jgi:hypothetical protein
MKEMVAKALSCLALLAAGLLAGNGQWMLATSTLSYCESVSHGAKGRATCWNGQCNFRIEALVKSFETGDLDRDAQMILITRGAQFPVMTVRMSMPDSALSGASFACDVEVDFAGRTAKYARVPFQVSMTGVGMRITGAIPARSRDFKIDSALTELPVLVDVTWRPGY